MARKYIWTNNNLKEVLPGVNPPLVTSMAIHLINPVLTDIFGIKSAEDEMLKDINGCLYFNGTLLFEGLRKRYNLNNVSLADFFGGEKNTKPSIKEISLKAKISIFILAARFIGSALFLEGKYKKVLKKLSDENIDYENKVTALQDPKDYLSLYKKQTVIMNKIFIDTLKTLIPAMALYYLFVGLCKKWLKENHYANDLLAVGTKESEMLHVFSELWKISEEIKKDVKAQSVFKTVRTNTDLKHFFKTYPDSDKLYLNFLQQYGYRCPQELNISLPRWKEDPTFIIETLKGYLDSPSEKNPLQQLERAKAKQREALGYAKAHLSLWKYSLLNYLIKRNRFLVYGREEGKAQLVKFFYLQRQSLLSIGKYLKEKDALLNRDDIFMLRQEEIMTLKIDLDSAEKQKIKQLVYERKIEYEKNKELPLKDVIDETGIYKPAVPVNNGNELKGMGVSSGIVTGKVKVLTNALEINKLKSGEILVTDHTDPGWTPAFVIAGGVITNTGGMLSHASIVAREYGLPAIVNTMHATEVLKDGQIVEMNGETGIIKIL
jgi:pyruvate,water dikinase